MFLLFCHRVFGFTDDDNNVGFFFHQYHPSELKGSTASWFSEKKDN